MGNLHSGTNVIDFEHCKTVKTDLRILSSCKYCKMVNTALPREWLQEEEYDIYTVYDTVYEVGLKMILLNVIFFLAYFNIEMVFCNSTIFNASCRVILMYGSSFQYSNFIISGADKLLFKKDFSYT